MAEMTHCAFRGSCIVTLPHQEFYAVPVLAQSFMNKEKLIGCICQCMVAFSFSPHSAFRVSSLYEVDWKNSWKAGGAHEEEEGEKNGSLSYSLIKFDPSFRTGTVLQREMVGGFKGRRTWDCISK